MPGFYDRLAAFYHLIHQDWNASVLRQGAQLGGDRVGAPGGGQ